MKNIILYGPPGTGKTYTLQKIKKEYLDYEISDDIIRSGYKTNGYKWFVVASVILNNKNCLSSDKIGEAIRNLNITLGNNISTILKEHNIIDDILGNNKEPRIFEEIKDSLDWRVIIDKIPNEIYKKYFIKGEKCRCKFVTFHQSFSYESFIEGIKPNVKNNIITYDIEDGILKEICKEAKENKNQRYALFIDEINRGNVSEIFGETISLIEEDKRLGEVNELEVILPYSKEKFGIPNNLDIYGTMNSLDKSITSVDIALRRRFKFKKIKSDDTELKQFFLELGLNIENIDGVNILKLKNTLNNRIELLLDDNYLIGNAYFFNIRKLEDIVETITEKIIPLLEEYFYDDLEKIQIIFNDLDESGELNRNAIYCHEVLESDKLFRFLGENNIEDRKKFYVSTNINLESIIKIYDLE